MKLVAVVLGCLAVLIAADAFAQDQPLSRRFAVEVQPGWVGFADDGIADEGLVGASLRMRLSPRISVGPEVSHISGNRHSHLVVTGNLTVDVRKPPPDQRLWATPFVVLGGGVFRTTEEFPGGDFSSSDGAFTAGGGVRVQTRQGFIAGAEARIGWELHLRLNAILGFSF